jgi:hypothetical protein
MLTLKARSNCWICEGWSEVKFIWRPGKSSEDDAPDYEDEE